MPKQAIPTPGGRRATLLEAVLWFCISNKLVVALGVIALVFGGLSVAPFDWDIGWLPRNPVPVDAIPDLGENQQIVFTEWRGRSPRDIEDQVTYPLTVSLLGIPGVKTVRGMSNFGFSSIILIFEEDIEFYWSRSRIIEKLNSLPAGSLPEGVQPALGPDATGLGQIFWYTLEGRDPDGNPTGGWDLDELRSVQDWQVRYALLAAGGVSEVAPVGGFPREYQIDVDPDAMRAHGVTLQQVFDAIHMSNVDVGARSIEINRVEYIIRGLGALTSLEDIEETAIRATDGVPIRIKDVARVGRGPALRRGALDKEGAEAVGGVVVARYGANPLEVIKNIKEKIDSIAPGLPRKAVLRDPATPHDTIASFAETRGFDAFDATGALDQEAWLAWLRQTEREEWPAWITTSQVTIVPFYDRSGLIHETLGTLSTALTEEILVTVIVILLMVFHLRSSILISTVLPLAVLLCFIAMKAFGVDANVVALSGIAIAIGTMVDMGVIVCENILRKLEERAPGTSRAEAIFHATSEVGGAVLTAVSTTIVGFLPVFSLTAAEGKLFKPLAFTKTFALGGSVMVALLVLPALAHLLFWEPKRKDRAHRLAGAFLVVTGLAALAWLDGWIAWLALGAGGCMLVYPQLPPLAQRFSRNGLILAVAAAVSLVLADHWLPLGPAPGYTANALFVMGLLGGVLGFLSLFRAVYGVVLRFFLNHKFVYLGATAVIIFMGFSVWLGFPRIFSFVPGLAERVGIPAETVRQTRFWTAGARNFPGMGKEFMPRLDEGSFLFMPSMMPHASIGEALDVLQFQDRAIAAIPEVEQVVGKIGRAESALDPAPVSMVETVVNYKSEYVMDEHGRRLRFRYDEDAGDYVRDAEGELIPDSDGRLFRQWRDHIKRPEDIWDEIVAAAEIPGSTSAPMLQPIETRILMLQTGMRAPMGVKVKGSELETIERAGLEIERLLKEVPGVKASAVFADRVVGKPYIEIDIDRRAIARHGISMRTVQDVIEVALGGRQITTTIEGRERYPVRVRYLRELRDDLESIERILVPASGGAQIPLVQLAEFNYVRGPQSIKSEDTFLISYVLFDMLPGRAEVEVVEACKAYLKEKEAAGELDLSGVEIAFAGSYENQVRSEKTLRVVIPVALLIIFFILYLQFRSVATTGLVFSTILLAWSGGFLLLWCYAQPWFLNVEILGTDLRTLFQVQSFNLSVAIWVGFLALFGIASDDGVIIATYLDQSFAARRPDSIEAIREATLAAAKRRIRPCLMTVATTLLALLPVLSSTGRGSDIMVPMAIPSFGGMLLVLLSVFLVPVLYCLVQEIKWGFQRVTSGGEAH